MRRQSRAGAMVMWITLALWLSGPLVLGCGVVDLGAEDDSGSSSKSKKKKKKRGKKKKKKRGKKKKKAPEDDGDPKPSPVPPKAATTCAAVVTTLECMRDSLPPSSRAEMDRSIDQIKKSIEQSGSASEQMCVSILKSLRDSAKSVGCKVPSTPTAPDTPTPVPGEPAPRPQPPRPRPTSRAPSASEWSSVTREVVVIGGSKLNCESKLHKGWLRVHCRGNNHSGGTPTAVRITDGGSRFDADAKFRAGSATLLVRFEPGLDLDVEFKWTDRTHTLSVEWPKGSPEPAIKGRFDPKP